nr:hypothetical protein [Candidatus Sigynarchaeota archaeon]
ELFYNGSNFGVDRSHKDANGSADTWDVERFLKLHGDLGNTSVDVTFKFDRFQETNKYMMLALLLDAWLVRRPIYTSWPIMGTRLPDTQFDTYTVLCVITFIVIGFFTMYIAWNPFHPKERKREQRLDATTAALIGRKEGDVI